jgi:hypothetical protein
MPYGTPVLEESTPSRPFRQRPEAANVQWLASPRVVPELGGYDEPTPTLELGPFGAASYEQHPGEGCSGERPRNSI